MIGLLLRTEDREKHPRETGSAERNLVVFLFTLVFFFSFPGSAPKPVQSHYHGVGIVTKTPRGRSSRWKGELGRVFHKECVGYPRYIFSLSFTTLSQRQAL